MRPRSMKLQSSSGNTRTAPVSHVPTDPIATGHILERIAMHMPARQALAGPRMTPLAKNQRQDSDLFLGALQTVMGKPQQLAPVLKPNTLELAAVAKGSHMAMLGRYLALCKTVAEAA